MAIDTAELPDPDDMPPDPEDMPPAGTSTAGPNPGWLSDDELAYVRGRLPVVKTRMSRKQGRKRVTGSSSWKRPSS